MRLVEAFAASGSEDTVEIDGLVYPCPCVVEDDDGIRLFVSGPTRMRPMPEVILGTMWARAHALGAAAIVLVSFEGTRRLHSWVFAEEWMDRRHEHGDSFQLDPWDWHGSPDGFPTYGDMLRMVKHADEERAGHGPGTFVHLHAHSEFSPLDGLSMVKEMVGAVTADGQTALALTDHGTCAGHPVLQKEADKAGIKPIFGIEANFVPDRHRRTREWVDETTGKRVTDAAEARAEYRHLVLWAMDDQGLRNLWAMSTEANRTGFYDRPRLDWEVLETYSEGVMASTACIRGPLAESLLSSDPRHHEEARTVLARLMAIFPDRLYVEVQTNQLQQQIELNQRLVALAREYDLPIIAAADSHYPQAEDRAIHEAWIASQTDKSLTDDADLFAGGQHYHLMAEAEVRDALRYLDADVVDEAIANTVVVAERCNAQIRGEQRPPVYSKQGGVQADVDRTIELALGSWERKLGAKVAADPGLQEVYEARFEREMRLLIDKSFCGYFLMVWDYVKRAKEHGILVGPGRGSGGGCLVAYLLDITEVDPIEGDLMFERFLTEGRAALPDFDIDFAATKRAWLTRSAQERWGEEHVVRVGTHSRLKSKSVVRAVHRLLKDTYEIDYRDIDKVCALIDEADQDTAGIGHPWDDLWEQFGDLPMLKGDDSFTLDRAREKYPELFRLADGFVGRLKTYGKHPAGLIISTDTNLWDSLPLRWVGKDEPLVTEFDGPSLEDMGYVKFDLLTLRNLDTIQLAVDLIKERTGRQVNIYTDALEDDPVIWEEIGRGNTLGIFQIETPSGMRMAKEFKPRSVNDLADMITLVRPGPTRSGLRKRFIARRAGLEPVDLPDPRLEGFLDRTYGCLIYQEDIIRTCQVLGGYSSSEADEVRRLLGKKKVELVEEAGREFVKRCVERGMDERAAMDLWAQMAEFARYSFNRAHAREYALVGKWTSWLKFVKRNTPFMLTSLLSTVKKERIPEFIDEARRYGYKVLPPDINESRSGFSLSADGTAVRYGLDSVMGIGDAAVEAIAAGQPYTSFADLLERKGGKANMGHVKTLVRLGACDSLVSNRKALETYIERLEAGDDERCVFKDDVAVGPNGLPCVFRWDEEPQQVNPKTGRKLKLKPPPKRCTKRCRNYTPPEPMDLEQMCASVEPYSVEEIRERELQEMGVMLSSTPFDDLPEDVLADCMTAEQLEDAAEGVWHVAGLLTRQRSMFDKYGRKMGFLSLTTHRGVIDVTVFSQEWEAYSRDFHPNRLAFWAVTKNDRGYNLEAMVTT